jgi:hypothetical protein
MLDLPSKLMRACCALRVTNPKHHSAGMTKGIKWFGPYWCELGSLRALEIEMASRFIGCVCLVFLPIESFKVPSVP